MSALVAPPANSSIPLNIIYSLNEELGQLAESLTIFKVDNLLTLLVSLFLFLFIQKHQVNLLGIESRSSIKVPGYEIMVEVNVKNNPRLNYLSGNF